MIEALRKAKEDAAAPEEIARHEGAMAKPQLQAFLDAHL